MDTTLNWSAITPDAAWIIVSEPQDTPNTVFRSVNVVVYGLVCAALGVGFLMFWYQYLSLNAWLWTLGIGIAAMIVTILIELPMSLSDRRHRRERRGFDVITKDKP